MPELPYGMACLPTRQMIFGTIFKHTRKLLVIYSPSAYQIFKVTIASPRPILDRNGKWQSATSQPYVLVYRSRRNDGQQSRTTISRLPVSFLSLPTLLLFGYGSYLFDCSPLRRTLCTPHTNDSIGQQPAASSQQQQIVTKGM